MKENTLFLELANIHLNLEHLKELVKYVSVKEWDDGYIVVDCLHDKLGIVEDYIDLIPMMENLFLDAKEILSPVRKVEIENDKSRNAG